jgi:prolyl oligopeptidase
VQPFLAPLAALSAHAQEDELQWLEEVDGKKPLAWVGKQNKATEKELGKVDGFDALQERLLAILDADDRIPVPSQMGAHWYNFWQDKEHVQGIWRRTTRASYESGNPTWETVLDLDALSAAEGKRWVWHGSTCLPPEYRRCLVSISNGGTDADETREFDTVDKAFVADGFRLPEAKSRVAWLDRDTVFVGTDWGQTMTDSGYPRQSRTWKRGTSWEKAELVFEGQQADVAVSAYADLTPGFERQFVNRGVTFYTSELYLRQPADGKLVRVEVPDDASASVWREWLVVELKSDWAVGDHTWPTGSLLATKFDTFLTGDRTFLPLFTPADRVSLAGWTATRHHLVVTLLDHVKHHLVVLTPQADGSFAPSEIAGLPTNGTVSAWPVDSDESDELFVMTNDFLTPATLSLGSAVPGAPAPKQLRQATPKFDAAGLVVEQHEAVSKDGTRVPYFQVFRQGLALDGTHPTVINGYGGFEIAMMPAYSGGVGAGWLEKGGVYVLANIRGGGEFGPAWHQAALKEKRPRAYEDFAAIAQDLIDRKVTSPAHLGAMGGSNGGLLMGNMAMGWPELFSAIVCQVPLLDMRRFNKLLAGASWMGEYGDPDDPEQWKFIQTFSPYHLVKPDVDYPRMLFVTSTKDDRVHPGHARKMAARMKAQKHDVLYWENTEGGHGGAANNQQRARMWALSWSFLWSELSAESPADQG